MKKNKLGYRLEQLKQMVIKDYDHIWDCCCDHGYLGMAILQQKSINEAIETNQTEINQTETNCTVHFVDIISNLMIQLNDTLERFYTKDSSENHFRWEASCQDVSTIKLTKKQSHLIIIAGVSGEKTIDLIQGIFNNNKQINFELLLCPLHQNYLLREFLIQQKFGLIQEKLIKENNRYYEVLHISKSALLELSTVGSKQWDYSRQDDRVYLDRMITHFEKKQKAPQKTTLKILEAYQKLRVDLSANQVIHQQNQ